MATTVAATAPAAVAPAAALPSVFRLIWDGMRRKPKVFRLFVAAMVIWVGYVGMVIGVALVEHKAPPLKDLAFPLMQAAWAGFMLLDSARGLTASAVQQDTTSRWLKKDPTVVDISGTALERARERAVATRVMAPPDPAVIALPVLTAMGAACLGFSLAMMLAVTSVGWFSSDLFGHSPWPQYAFSAIWVSLLVPVLVTNLAAVGRTNMRVHAWGRDRAEAAARAAADVERVRLVALQTQMNPQFLFNTLNTVAALAVSEPDRAERVVEHLSAVLRHSLQRADQPAATVDDEMGFVREYVAVEKERLGWRLRVTWAIDDETRDLRVPAMSVQPLVEEAIVRGVESRQAGGDIRVSTTHVASGYLLRLTVEVDGPGEVDREGKGSRLADLRQRLRAEFDDAFALDEEVSSTGLRIAISIPAVRMNGETGAPLEHQS